MKTIRVGVDLDGVVVNKPVFIPKSLIEWLFRAHHNHGRKYRIPKSKLEIAVRKLSHHWLIRPPIKANITIIKKLSKAKNIKIYLISGRYQFLKNQTAAWLKVNGLSQLFPTPYINLNDLQPHIFKEQMAKKLKLDYFFDDDPIIINHFKQTNPKIKAYLTNHKNNLQLKKLLQTAKF